MTPIMKSEHGMTTLMTVFSGTAALMCLLVGLQLLSLESQIGRAAVPEASGADSPFSQWQAEVQTGAIMSLGAGVRVFLFGLRHLSTTRNSARKRKSTSDMEESALDLESLSVRIFEVDEEDRSFEITSGDEATFEPDNEQPSILWHPLNDLENDVQPDPVSAGDPAESIVQSIQEAAPHGVGRHTVSRAARSVRKSWRDRLFGRRSRR
jgi:hypothetical protein